MEACGPRGATPVELVHSLLLWQSVHEIIDDAVYGAISPRIVVLRPVVAIGWNDWLLGSILELTMRVASTRVMPGVEGSRKPWHLLQIWYSAVAVAAGVPPAAMPVTPSSVPGKAGGAAGRLVAACGLWQSAQVTCRVIVAATS